MGKKTVYFLIDCSGTMHENGRGDAVNIAMEKIVREGLPEVKRRINSEELELSFAVLGFSGQFPNKIKEFLYKNLDEFRDWSTLPLTTFNGTTPTGAAIETVARYIEDGVLRERGIDDPADAIILVSDGEPNGTNPTYEEALQNALQIKSFNRTIRVTLGINVTDVGEESLKKFGRVSAKMERAGLQSYYSCNDEYLDEFIDILVSVTVMASVGVG